MIALLENNTILFIGIASLAIGGYKMKALSLSGAIGTVMIGSMIALGFHGYGLLLIGVFFITSSFWSKFKQRKKESIEKMHEKGSKRDIVQVFANGLIPGVFGVLNFYLPSEYWLYGFITSIAVANADTWASEIGTLSKGLPFSFFSWRRVERGTSGAVSALGSFACLLGSGLIAVSSLVLFPSVTWSGFILILLLGVAGCFLDTILGATVQAQYQCQVCGKRIERKSHCAMPANLIKGVAFVNNDVVNLSAILIASIAALITSAFL